MVNSSYQKTGMASRMRAWMKNRKRPFTARMLCGGLEPTDRDARQKIQNAIPDFVKRGEIYRWGQISGQSRQVGITLSPQQKRRQNKQYKYNHAWRRAAKGKDRPKILKAMYIWGESFAASDIERISGAGRNHVEKIIKTLVEDRDLIIVGRRTCAAGVGAEHLYNVTNRERFKIEVME